MAGGVGWGALTLDKFFVAALGPARKPGWFVKGKGFLVGVERATLV